MVHLKQQLMEAAVFLFCPNFLAILKPLLPFIRLFV